MMFSSATNQKCESLCRSSMASSDVVMIRESSTNIPQHVLSQQYLCDLTGRVRMQESVCNEPGTSSRLSALPMLGNGYGAASSPATPLDSPTQSLRSTDPPVSFSEQVKRRFSPRLVI